MAVTNEQVLSAISEYRSENARPCPAKYLVEKFGSEALDVIKSLKDNGTIVGKRGRTGGLLPSDAAPAPVAEGDSSTAESSEGDTDSVADQFAALAAKLAADDTGVAVG